MYVEQETFMKCLDYVIYKPLYIEMIPKYLRDSWSLSWIRWTNAEVIYLELAAMV